MLRTTVPTAHRAGYTYCGDPSSGGRRRGTHHSGRGPKDPMAPRRRHHDRPSACPSARSAACLLAAALAAATAATAQAPPPAATTAPRDQPKLDERIAGAIRDLGHRDWKVREAATRLLWSLGARAEPALRDAVASNDAEIAARAKDILEKFAHGLYPDTPADIAAVIDDLRRGLASKREAIATLLKLGPRAYRTLFALFAAEADAGNRIALFAQFRKQCDAFLAGLLADGQTAQAEDLLRLAAHTGHDDYARHYAAFVCQQGRLDETIRRAEAAPHAKSTDKLLAYLYRAAGDLRRAFDRARRAGDKPLADALAFERGDWKQLVRSLPADPPDNIEQLGFWAAYHRLAGDENQAAAALDKVRRLGEQRPDDCWSYGEVLLINGRCDEAIDLYVRSGRPGVAFQLLCRQMRFDEAFDLLAKTRAGGKTDVPLEIALADVLAEAGETDKARQHLIDLAGRLARQAGAALRQVLGPLYGCGGRDEALAHLAALMGRCEKPADAAELIGAVFTRRTRAARRWWAFFRAGDADQTHRATLQRVHDLLDPSAEVSDFADLLQQAERAMKAEPEEGRHQWLNVLAETCSARRRHDLALQYYQRLARATGARSDWERVGDLLAKRGRWDEAAAAYEKACRSAGADAPGLLSRGWALRQAGKESEGRRLMDVALLLPLGDARMRLRIGDALARRGLKDQARLQVDLARRAGEPRSFGWFDATYRAAQAAALDGKHLQAAAWHEQYRLQCLKLSTGMVAEGYLIHTHRTHFAWMQGCLADGRLDDALRHARRCYAVLPGNISPAIELVPALDKAGRKQQADEVFAGYFALTRSACERFPDNSSHHNSLAWLAACCNREMDEALKHAQRAHELKPNSAAILDTLAEVHFRMGRREEAVKLMKQCIRLDPDWDYFRKQLKRFESPGPASRPAN